MSKSFTSEQKRLLQLLHNLSYIKGEVKLASGKISNFYIDCRKTVLTAEGHFLIGKVFYDIIKRYFPEAKAVGGVVLGAAPIASAISYASFGNNPELPAFYLRKEPKTHGTGKLLEGTVPKGAPVVIVEDVVTTGGSTLKAVEVAKNEGLNPIGVIALIDREENDATAKLLSQIRYVSVFKKSDFSDIS